MTDPALPDTSTDELRKLRAENDALIQQTADLLEKNRALHAQLEPLHDFIRLAGAVLPAVAQLREKSAALLTTLRSDPTTPIPLP